MREPVTLRPLLDSDDDYRVVLRWVCDPRVLEWVYGRDQVYTLDRVRGEWNPATCGAGHVWPHLILLGARPIGYLQLVWVQPNNDGYSVDGDTSAAYAFDLFIGEPDLWGAGLGAEACARAIDALFARGAQRVFIDPRVMNERAVHVYEKVGFRKVKVLPGNEFHEGQAWDCWLMELDFAAFWAHRGGATRRSGPRPQAE